MFHLSREHLARAARRVGMPMLATIAALLVGAIGVAALGESPWAAARTVVDAGFSCTTEYCNLGSTLSLAAPIIFCALGAVVVLRAGLFSIGQEGQYALGGLAAAVVGAWVNAPGGIHPILALIASATAGALWGLIPAVLRIFLGVNELIVTIVLNTMAGLLLNFLVNYPLRAEASSVGYTPSIAESARLPVWDTSTKFGLGFVLAIIACGAVWFHLNRTPAGYEQRMSGEAPLFAHYVGMSSKKAVLRAGLIGGALAGLGGGVQVLGVNYRVIEGFSDGTGFTGLTAAILGGVSAIGAGIVGTLYAGITVGAVNGLQIQLSVPREIGSTVLALMIVFVAAQHPLLTRIERWRDRRRANQLIDEGRAEALVAGVSPRSEPPDGSSSGVGTPDRAPSDNGKPRATRTEAQP
ncbi:ABC transporter permease [Demequina sp. SO4-13]|uniref:ABC transporter permease n=1 Tax=Demequina sp. SO4-13 TaxID=3401027 RepID=UPI003AF9D2CC